MEKSEKYSSNKDMNALAAFRAFLTIQAIYIENQFFIRSGKYWCGNSVANSIPEAIVNLIIDKMTRPKKFKVYVIHPFYPEGNRDSFKKGAIQEILDRQYKTKLYMFSEIQKELDKLRRTSDPKYFANIKVSNYLIFFYFRTSEPVPSSNLFVGQLKEHSKPLLTQIEKLRKEGVKSVSHMIYVHSKFMLVDDEYVIIGSANINERSMAADRDTELCIGAYQNEKKRVSQTGQVGSIHRTFWC
jgi:phospholipase D1/2